MIEVSVTVDTSRVSRLMRDLARDQIPFATKNAINQTAVDFQRVQRTHQRVIFNVRRPRFVDRSVKVKPFATKRSLEAPSRAHQRPRGARTTVSGYSAPPCGDFTALPYP